MSGIIRHFTPDAPKPVNQPGVSRAQQQAEQRAEAGQQQETAAYQASRNVRRTGGMRLLFSPLRDVKMDQSQEAFVSAVQKLLGNMGGRMS
jgi:hypothetical protein